MAINDLYYIEDRLKEIDPNILRIDFDYDNLKHQVIAVDKLGTQYVAMTVKHGELDARVVRRIQQIDPRKFNPFDDIGKWLHKKELDEDKKVNEIARGMAETLRKPLMHDAMYG
ncbi:hypothetical protein [Paenibacillus oryzisoli]|uniref:Uncharacterized protein n=1 Tax=Paenibacillus oryzisoli TaxID=1850517 RepID=A0A198AE75_9BACL|nr:hypothetical protein [Paenibacillus oryzisoli]OAS19248.1 hypothetical protein A8708_26415 [Paenibacillus oryzisoli]